MCQSSKLKKIPNFILQDMEKQTLPHDSTKLSFEWSHTRVSSAYVEVRNTIIELTLASAWEWKGKFFSQTKWNRESTVMTWVYRSITLHSDNNFSFSPLVSDHPRVPKKDCMLQKMYFGFPLLQQGQLVKQKLRSAII